MNGCPVTMWREVWKRFRRGPIPYAKPYICGKPLVTDLCEKHEADRVRLSAS